MSLKVELEAWGEALKAYDEQDFPKAIRLFDKIADTSKILCNIGLIYAAMGEHELAVANFAAACDLDKHLAIGYFQTGVSNFLMRKYETAYKDFEEALFHLRSNQSIDYDQLGLKFQLWRAEILFNKGLCQVYMGNVDFGMRDLEAAWKDKTQQDHNVIAEAVAERGKDYTVFSIPVGVLYRPSEIKLKNVKAKDFLGKAKLVAASEDRDAFTEFVGVRRLQGGMGPAGQRLERSITLPIAQSRDIVTPIYDALASSRTNSPVPAARIIRSQSDTPPPPPSKTGGGTLKVTFAPSLDRGRLQQPVSAPDKPRAASSDEGIAGNRGPPPSSFRDNLAGPSPRGSPRASGSQDEQARSRSRLRDPQPSRRAPSAPSQQIPQSRGVTEFYDDYLDAYASNETPEPISDVEPAANRRVEAWMTKTPFGASPDVPPSRTPSQAVQPAKRPVRTTNMQNPVETGSNGSASQYDGEARSNSTDSPWRIRVKIHYREDTRGMAVMSNTTFEDFKDLVVLKFEIRWTNVIVKFKDEDGGKISLKDSMDWDMAVEVAKAANEESGKPEGKLEMWLTSS